MPTDSLPLSATLSADQQDALNTVDTGQNILLTGEGGTGKSRVLQQLKLRLGSKLSVTASTGIAALQVGGCTLDSFCGMTPKEESVDTLIRRVMRTASHAIENIEGCDVLAIDEVSMVSAEKLDRIDQLFKAVRNSSEPFGGTQMILIGDYLQLPPFSRNGPASYGFKAKAYRDAGFQTKRLTHIFRQEHRSFAEALSHIRLGRTDHPSYGLIESRIGAVPPKGLKPLRISCRNDAVDQINELELQKIQGESVTYYAEGSGSQNHLDNIRKYCLAPERLVLKIGAQVMLLTNEDPDIGLVNGAIGHVAHMGNESVTVRFLNGTVHELEAHTWQISDNLRTMALWSQLPLRLAYANTVHKTQGSTIDFMECDLAGAWECGQVYVALSRAKTLDGLFIKSLPKTNVRAHPEALRFYQS